MKKLLIGALALIAFTNIHASYILRVDVEKDGGADFSIIPAGETGIQKSVLKATTDIKLEPGLRLDKDTIIIVDGTKYTLTSEPEIEDLLPLLPEETTLVITDEKPYITEIIPVDSLMWTLEETK